MPPCSLRQKFNVPDRGALVLPIVTFVSHPEVVIDANVPVPDWPLSELGRRRIERFARTWPREPIDAIWSSDERKSIDCAQALAAAWGLEVRTLATLGENDRSATGYLPREEFEATADVFFAHPEHSVRGWERAVDAQARIRRAIDEVLDVSADARSVMVCSHGGVGALLLCALRGIGITRAEDQPSGQGNYYRFVAPEMQLLHGWSPIDP
jgi:broad specificity phosphatase PhoE